MEVDDDSVQDTDGDIPRRRLNKLKKVIKTLLFKRPGSVFSERHIVSIIGDIKPKELESCQKILNMVSPYIHEKQYMYSIVCRIPFMMMCNDIFRCTGYSKFTKKLVPMTHPSTVLCLKLDAPTIFSIVSSTKAKKPMDLRNFDNNIIKSRQVATESKDAIFSSFFDLGKINNLCDSYGLVFAHNMLVLPGCKTLRINGFLKSSRNKPFLIKPEIKTTEKSTTMADDSETKSKKIIQQAEVDALLRSVQTLEVKRKELFLENSIRDLKRKWIKKGESPQLTLEQNANNTNVYTQIQSAKAHRSQIDQQIQNEKSKLAKARQILFDSANEKLERTEGGVGSKNKLVISQQNWKGIAKAEDCTIDPILLNSGKVTFSGTDNGLISMTDTANLSMEKFKFHLQLYNRFAVLNEGKHLDHIA